MNGRPRDRLRRWRALPHLAWHYRFARSRRLPYHPLRLWIEPTNACNLACPLCPTGTAPARPRGLMDFALFEKIVAEVRGRAVDVNLHHRGESLLHPRLAQMAALAADAGLRIRLHTNATLLDEARSAALAEAGLWTVSLSIDGASEADYERARPGGDFAIVIANARRFIERAARQPRRRRPRVVVEAMAANGLTPAELRRRFAALFAGCRPGRVVVKRPHNWGGAIAASSPAPEEGQPPCSAPRGSRPEEGQSPFSQTKKGTVPCVCTLPWYALTILYDGRVLPCPQDYYGRLELGNVREQTLAEIWNGPAMVALRDRLARRDVAGLAPCETCDRIRRRTVAGVPVEFAARFLREFTVG